MTAVDHQQLMDGFADVVRTQEWDRLSEVINEDAILEYPQSGERFRGIANVRAQFEAAPSERRHRRARSTSRTLPA